MACQNLTSFDKQPFRTELMYTVYTFKFRHWFLFYPALNLLKLEGYS